MVSARLTARLIKPTMMIDNARARVLRLFQSDHDNRTRGHEIIFRERVDVRDIGIFFPADARTSRSRLGTDIDPRLNTLYSTRRKRIDPVDQLTAQRTAGLDECFILKAYHAFHDQSITHGTKPTDHQAPHLSDC